MNKNRMQLTVEANANSSVVKAKHRQSILGTSQSVLMITPPLDENYWIYRVKVSDKQAIVAFPKFGTIGIGFQHEDEDWNTNLPHSCDATEIFKHIEVNKADATDSDCIAAIKMLQEQIKLQPTPPDAP